MNTFFKKCPSSKWTWQSPDGRTRNEIDYILSDRRGNIRDVQVATNLKFHIDHRMVRAAVTLNCRRYFARPRKPEAEKITRDMYKANIEAKLKQGQNNRTEEVQRIYNNIQTKILKSAEEASRNENGIRNKHKLSENMIRLIEKKEQLRKNIQKSKPHNEYAKINK